MADPKDFAAIVKQAEQAVKGVADPELRRVAFEKILAALLEKSEVGSNSGRHKAKKTASSSDSTAEKADRKIQGPKAYIRELVDEGFFSKPKSLPQVKAELENRGHHIAVTSLSGPLQALCQDKLLRRQKSSAPGKGGKQRQAYTYSEW
jgi:hypothetical protein